MLTVIGLVVGAVLVGQDMIRAAETRAQITQIEKYDSAVNTFRGKFGGIPGDLALTLAQQFGFHPNFCSGLAGDRDGNGLIDGYYPYQFVQGGGEVEIFWGDLTTANLIDTPLPIGIWANCSGGVNASGTSLNMYLPQAKIGHGNYVYVYETSGANWFGISSVSALYNWGLMNSSPSLSVVQAYNIDKKVDDGLPATGNVQAFYLTGESPTNSPNTPTSGGNSTSCYDTTTSTYSITYNNGSGANCALSFKFR